MRFRRYDRGFRVLFYVVLHVIYTFIYTYICSDSMGVRYNGNWHRQQKRNSTIQLVYWYTNLKDNSIGLPDDFSGFHIAHYAQFVGVDRL